MEKPIHERAIQVLEEELNSMSDTQLEEISQSRENHRIYGKSVSKYTIAPKDTIGNDITVNFQR